MALLDDVLHRLPDTGEVNIIATRTVTPGKQEEFEAILKEMVAGTLANDRGCLRYEWYRSVLPALISCLNGGRIGLPSYHISRRHIWS